MGLNHPLYFVCGGLDEKGKILDLWYVLTVRYDRFKSGDTVMVGGKEYILGKRLLLSRGEVVQYDLILRSEVLEL